MDLDTYCEWGCEHVTQDNSGTGTPQTGADKAEYLKLIPNYLSEAHYSRYRLSHRALRKGDGGWEKKSEFMSMISTNLRSERKLSVATSADDRR